MQERIWLRAIDFLIRAGKQEDSLEAQALTSQLQLWDLLTQGGTYDPAPQIRKVFWVHGLLCMLSTIQWLSLIHI